MTKQTLAVTVAGLLLAGSVSVMAGGACCAADKDAKATMKADCTAAFSKLNLSADQKAKLDALWAECKKEGCSKEAHAKMMKAVDEVLTPEQRSQWKEQCPQQPQSGKCPFTNKEGKS